MSWKRPECVVFPQVWMKFEAKDPDTGKSVQYRIQDLPEDRFQEALRLYRFFIRGHAMAVSLDCANDKEVERILLELIKDTLSQKITLVCLKDGSDEICGFNFLKVYEKNDEEIHKEMLNEKLEKTLGALAFIENKADPYGRYEVDKYLNSLGLLVLPKYRGIGLATEILKARIIVCRALGLKLTASTFTGIAAQKAAAKAGFVEDYSVLYEDFAKYEPYIEFPNIAERSAKFMSFRVD